MVSKPSYNWGGTTEGVLLRAGQVVARRPSSVSCWASWHLTTEASCEAARLNDVATGVAATMGSGKGPWLIGYPVVRRELRSWGYSDLNWEPRNYLEFPNHLNLIIVEMIHLSVSSNPVLKINSPQKPWFSSRKTIRWGWLIWTRDGITLIWVY